MPFGIGNTILQGGGPEVSAALQSRRFGDAVSPLSQVTGGSPMGGSSATPPIPLSPGQLPSSPVPVGQLQSGQGGQGSQGQKTDQRLVLEALVTFLKNAGTPNLTQF